MAPALLQNFRLGWKGTPGVNSLAYWACSQVLKKIKCCEYGPSSQFILVGAIVVEFPGNCTFDSLDKFDVRFFLPKWSNFRQYLGGT